jgi:hypothetical protein
MESLGAAISLAHEVCGTGHDIVRFLQNVADAPEEATRLAHQIELLVMLVNGVRCGLERSRKIHGEDEVFKFATVERALEQCRKETALIKDIVDKATNQKASGARLKQVLASAGLALKKKKIAEYERRMQYSIQLLNTAIITHAWEATDLV